MGSYKDSPEWKSLNRIWQACGQEIQQERKADFALITAFIREHLDFADCKSQVSYMQTRVSRQTNNLKKTQINAGDNYGYIATLSGPCQSFVREHQPNLYHSFMAILDRHSDELDSCESMVHFYMEKYQEKRPWLAQNESFVKEVAALCWKNFFNRRH